MNYQNDIYCLENITMDYEGDYLMEILNNRGLDLAHYWGVYRFPDNYKITIHLCSRQEFRQVLEENNALNVPSTCVAVSIGMIYVLTYDEILDCYTKEDYVNVVLHECVHVLQQIATGVTPCDCTWLYEAMACFLAGQDNSRIGKIPSWYSLRDDFYSNDGCYYVAYQIGQYLCEHNDENTILTLCKNYELANKIGQEIYLRLYVNN